MEDAFDLVEQSLRSGGSEAAFDFLVNTFREQRNYPLLFEARLMKKRHELNLPLIQVESLDDVSNETRRAYDEGLIEAAREVGGLFLAEGDILRAWPYFRAIGEVGPVAAAIERIEPGEGIEPIIEIAFLEGVHPQKGFELILAHHGICRAISSFEQYPGRKGREGVLGVLVRSLHRELIASLKRAISRAEGQAPETESVPQLIENREWLFGEYDYYVDTSHLVSVLRFSLESNDRETLALALELTEYGKRLSSQFQYRSDPPFENFYDDHAVYLRAILGQDIDGAIAHFCHKLADIDPNEGDGSAAQVVVGFLARLERYPEAIDISLKHLRGLSPNQLACPSVLQLCQRSGNYQKVIELAREQRDLLSFTAGVLQSPKSC